MASLHKVIKRRLPIILDKPFAPGVVGELKITAGVRSRERCPMKKSLIMLFALLVSVSSADARRGRHHHGPKSAPVSQELDRAKEVGVDRDYRAASDEDDVTGWLPPGWQLQPIDPNWKGRRYISPDGFASIAVFSSQVSELSVPNQMRDIAFVEGEQISYLRGERDWIIVSGSKDNHIFYRKAALACGGKSWHRIEFNYPFEDKVKLDNLVSRFSRRLDSYRSAGCQSNVSVQ